MSSVVVPQEGKAAEEVEGDGASAINRTAPIEALGRNKAEQTIGAESVARHGQFQRRSKSTHAVVAAPT